MLLDSLLQQVPTGAFYVCISLNCWCRRCLSEDSELVYNQSLNNFLCSMVVLSLKQFVKPVTCSLHVKISFSLISCTIQAVCLPQPHQILLQKLYESVALKGVSAFKSFKAHKGQNAKQSNSRGSKNGVFLTQKSNQY